MHSSSFNRVAALGALALLASTSVPAAAATTPGATLTIASAIALDLSKQTVTLPLHRASVNGATQWYIITDSSQREDAKHRGVNFAPALAEVGANCATCVADLDHRTAPDFSPDRTYNGGTAGFPPVAAKPGATASSTYSPFVHIGDAIVNAPVVATGDDAFDVKTHANTQERVVAIDVKAKTVTLLLARGFFDGKPIVYLSTEASDAGASAIERATFVPSLAKAQGGKIPILALANGSDQGFAYVAKSGHLADDATAANSGTLGSSLNVITNFPVGQTAGAYTPLWDANIGVWTPAAIAAGEAKRISSAATFYAHAQEHHITAPDGKSFGPVGIVVNCPVVALLDK